MATFAAFGGFATLVLAGFGGDRKVKFVAHLGLAVTGSVVLVIGTAVSSVTLLDAAVTLVVAFCVLFAGVVSANAASGATAALLAFVLPAASPGAISMVPSRLEGWWMASAVGTFAVLVVYARPPTDRLRRAAQASAGALAEQIEAALAGNPGEQLNVIVTSNSTQCSGRTGCRGSRPNRATGSILSSRGPYQRTE